MGFSFFRWLFQRDREAKAVSIEEFLGIYADCYVRDLAFESCANLVANAVSKCELQTFHGNQPVKGAEYYLWNISPNQNQNSTAFWHKLIHHLYRDGRALVVEHSQKLYVADSFDRREYALYDDLFSEVSVGDFTYSRSFNASEVMFFELSSRPVRQLLDGLYSSYSSLIAYGMKGYQRSRGEKGVLELDTTAAGDKVYQETFEDLKNGGFRKFAEAENAMLPMYRGMKYTSLGSKTYNADTTRDIRAMIDDVVDFTARAYGIPSSLVNGSVQDVASATGQFLTFCLDPLTDNLAEEINRKRYGERLMGCGDFVRFNTEQVLHADLFDNASAISTLVGSGAFCVNDIRSILGQSLILEPWANEYFITRNFSTVEELVEEFAKGETT